ncbi:MAG: CPBP family intramembrane glutamic endopeptidase [Bacteroidota bacterium]
MFSPFASIIQRVPIGAFFILLLLVFISGSLSMFVLHTFAQIQGIELQTLVADFPRENTYLNRQYLRWSAIINQCGLFLIPALAFASLARGKDWMIMLRLTKVPSAYKLLLGIVLLLCFMPIAQYAFYLNQQLPLPGWMRSMEANANNLVNGLLVMENISELSMNLLTIALIPALAEEVLFRGILQQKIADYTLRPQWAIWLAAIIFSAVHGQFEGFFARMLLGAALGYLFFWTQNLWIPIVAHLTHNGFQVFVAYVHQDQLPPPSPENSEPISMMFVLLCSIFVFGIGRLLYKSRHI